ncbi:MAG TPA: RNA 2',3'-cyclic phosphodiesterase [Thermoanaerobaculaceae bacterium]|nr:RNA 2',3'-cyclic phosphodiesterase [Thermoanaerobaculaceae bacterium]HPS79615.1 RNA 2',3'-cyclic phosphodiesterase [Thermoanaerobaculaceae bacterium]
MRLFIAVPLPQNIQQVLASGLGTLCRALPPAHWVRPEGIHVTLKFLGEQLDTMVTALDREVPAALAALAPATVHLAGGGFFPTPRRPRVAWVGGQAEGLVTWASAIDAAATSLGLAPEERPFSLHLTLARLERPWPEPAVQRFLDEVAGWELATFVAREAVLYRSELKPGGAVYSALRHWPAGGGHGA